MNADLATLARRPAGIRRLSRVAGRLLASHWLCSSSWAEVAPVEDKSHYNLLHPTPRELMREMSTDRPDQTESPYTVDAGQFQAEMDAVSAVFDRDRSGGGDLQTTGWGTSLNLKAGLLNNVDLQFDTGCNFGVTKSAPDFNPFIGLSLRY